MRECCFFTHMALVTPCQCVITIPEGVSYYTPDDVQALWDACVHGQEEGWEVFLR